MTTEQAQKLARENQIALESKRAAIINRLMAAQAEIDSLRAISEHAKYTTPPDCAFNFSSGSIVEPSELLPFIKGAGMERLIEWEKESTGYEERYRDRLTFPTETDGDPQVSQ